MMLLYFIEQILCHLKIEDKNISNNHTHFVNNIRSTINFNLTILVI